MEIESFPFLDRALGEMEMKERRGGVFSLS